jgi:inner membrane protein
MLIAHLPAGYLAYKTSEILSPTLRNTQKSKLIGILTGSLLPDLDVIWFYVVSDRRDVHHSYLAHTPIFWIGILLLFLFIAKIRNKNDLKIFSISMCVGAILHLALDSIARQIRWLYPLTNSAIQLVEIPPTHSWWVISFITHWTFLLEVALVILRCSPI